MTPSQDFYALFVHGIGTQDSHFADYAQKTLSAALSPRGGALYGRSVHYAPLFAMAADRFLKDVVARGSEGNATQKLTVNTLADAIQYAMNPALRGKIQGVLDYEFLRLRAPDEVIIFAHSLGCLAVVDWLRSRTGVKKARLITMGCNVGLFCLGMPWTAPPQVDTKGRWTNLWDEDDMLGFPVALPDRPEFAHVDDVEVSVGVLRGGGTGLAHIKYFTDHNLWSRTIPDLLLT